MKRFAEQSPKPSMSKYAQKVLSRGGSAGEEASPAPAPRLAASSSNSQDLIASRGQYSEKPLDPFSAACLAMAEGDHPLHDLPGIGEAESKAFLILLERTFRWHRNLTTRKQPDAKELFTKFFPHHISGMLHKVSWQRKACAFLIDPSGVRRDGQPYIREDMFQALRAFGRKCVQEHGDIIGCPLQKSEHAISR